MASYKCSVQIFNGQLYFHLYTGGLNTVILTTLNGINSTSLITVTAQTYGMMEFVNLDGGPSSIAFNGTTYDLAPTT